MIVYITPACIVNKLHIASGTCLSTAGTCFHCILFNSRSKHFSLSPVHHQYSKAKIEAHELILKDNYILNSGLAHTHTTMARGQQKIQAQQKAAAKQAKMKKASDQKTAAKKALIYTCPVCRTQMPDPKTYKQHFESKHPKQPLPADLQAP